MIIPCVSNLFRIMRIMRLVRIMKFINISPMYKGMEGKVYRAGMNLACTLVLMLILAAGIFYELETVRNGWRAIRKKACCL